MSAARQKSLRPLTAAVALLGLLLQCLRPFIWGYAIVSNASGSPLDIATTESRIAELKSEQNKVQSRSWLSMAQVANLPPEQVDPLLRDKQFVMHAADLYSQADALELRIRQENVRLGYVAQLPKAHWYFVLGSCLVCGWFGLVCLVIKRFSQQRSSGVTDQDAEDCRAGGGT